MRRYTFYIPFFVLALISVKGFAQRSCVFLPDSQNQEGEFDRPRPTLHLVRPLRRPAPLGIPNLAPDFPNINVDSNLSADQNETSIAINPTNPDNIIIGANDYRSDTSLSHFQSFDGGRTWSWGSFLANGPYVANPTDPAIAFNTAGKAFYSYGTREQFPLPINDVVCYTTGNGGKDWTPRIRVFLDSTGLHEAETFADKYYIAADNAAASPFNNRIYVAWAEYDLAGKDRIRLSFSTDNGVSWSVPDYVTSSGNFQSPIPATGVHGEVYVAYENLDSNALEIRFAASTDGGKTFPLNKKISGYSELGPYYSTDGVHVHPVIKDHLRANSFPSIAIDRSPAHNGRIYMTWAAMGSDHRHHIYLTLSDDSGNSWSAPVTIENDPSPIATDKFFPWIAIDDVTGDIGIVFYDSRSDPANVLTDLYMLFSYDGGQHFTVERISGASSDVRASSSGLSGFFGDYIGLAAHSKSFFPAWTDSRVGYDQDIYFSIVRPYAPSAPVNFTVTEDGITHLADLNWGHSGLTTFGLPLGNYVFRLQRSDGGLQIDLPQTARSYNDLQAAVNTDYTYTIQVVTSDQDTSLTEKVFFSPHANKESLPPILTRGVAGANQLQILFRIPDMNVAGTANHDLHEIYFLVNGIVADSFVIADDLRGVVKNYTYFNLPDGYYCIQLAIATRSSDGDTTLSALSPPRWLYSGAPLATYSENFSDSKNIFTVFAWDTTRAGGKLPGNFINDSLPDVPYVQGTDSWFVLPPVTITADAQTLEYSHIALVASGDSALIEVSTDDGVHFSSAAFYDKNSHPADWGNVLSGSKPVDEKTGLRYLNGKDAVIRFRLITHSSGGDGWFIDSIRFTNFLSVSAAPEDNSFHAALSPDPVRLRSTAKITLFSDKEAAVSVNIYSMLGKKENTLLDKKIIQPGQYELRFFPEEAGCYYFEAIAGSGQSEQRRYGKFIVLP